MLGKHITENPCAVMSFQYPWEHFKLHLKATEAQHSSDDRHGNNLVFPSYRHFLTTCEQEKLGERDDRPTFPVSPAAPRCRCASPSRR